MCLMKNIAKKWQIIIPAFGNKLHSNSFQLYRMPPVSNGISVGGAGLKCDIISGHPSRFIAINHPYEKFGME